MNSAGTVVVHIGPTAGSTLMTTGDHLVSWVEGSTTLQPGKYYLVLTSSCTSSCAKLFGAQGALNFLENVSVAVTSGGTVKSITPPADSYSWNGTTPAWSVH
ncbi:MAG TPA: hypothetical protein VHW45_02310 [Candidatus Sulfotelmatobacter sp.]|nr:hypothetical protein [Candidatus Sulfotelmatobacter sp.]